jgi:hypothetical protein
MSSQVKQVSLERPKSDWFERYAESFILVAHTIFLIGTYALITTDMQGWVFAALMLGIQLRPGLAIAERGSPGWVPAALRTVHMFVTLAGFGCAATVIYLDRANHLPLNLWVSLVVLVGLTCPTLFTCYSYFRAAPAPRA